MNKHMKSLLGYKGSKERDAMYCSVRDTCRNISESIRAFEKSLYVQRHAYYFRRVREWYDFSEVL